MTPPVAMPAIHGAGRGLQEQGQGWGQEAGVRRDDGTASTERATGGAEVPLGPQPAGGLLAKRPDPGPPTT